MVLALIACNVYEYYQKKKRLQQYQHYSKQSIPGVDAYADKRPEDGTEFNDNQGLNGYNEAQFTYSTIFGNYVCNEDNRVPVRPMSGWVAPHMWRLISDRVLYEWTVDCDISKSVATLMQFHFFQNIIHLSFDKII